MPRTLAIDVDCADRPRACSAGGRLRPRNQHPRQLQLPVPAGGSIEPGRGSRAFGHELAHVGNIEHTQTAPHGMVFLDDLRTHMGTLLVPKGFEVTETFLERMRNFGSGILTEKVRVLVSASR